MRLVRFFFFSSRRRHTRLQGDWSSDVCSSDLVALASRHAIRRLGHPAARRLPRLAAVAGALDDLAEPPAGLRRVQAVRIGGGGPSLGDIPPPPEGGARNSPGPPFLPRSE